MKKITLKNNIRYLYILFVSFIPSSIFAQATLEFTSGAGNPTGNGPTVANQVITFQKNTNNPTGNTFTAYTPTTKATFSLTNQQRTMIPSPNVGLMFGGTTSNSTGAVVNAFTLFPLVNGAGAPTNAIFTSGNSSAGTGIDVTANRNVALYLSLRPLYENGAALPTVGNPIRHQYADLVITFNRAVNNPIIHFSGCGGSIGSAGSYNINFTPEFELITSGLSLTRLSGSTEFSVPNSTEILNSAVLPNAATGSGAMSGSVMVNGNNITSVTFRVYIKGVHPNQGQALYWTQAITSQSGDVFTMGVSLSDCLAGTTAPSLSGTTITNTCPTTTVDLNSIHTGTTPSGSSLVWFTNNTHTGAAYATPTAATAGTYYAFYYDSTNNCYSSASNAVIVTVNTCSAVCTGTTAPGIQ